MNAVARILPVALLALGFLAAAPVAAHESVYSAVLSGPNEAPPNASPGTGLATVTIDFDLHTMRVQASFSGLLGTTTAAHIHCCTAVPGAGTVGVATTAPSFTAFPLGVTFGSYDRVFDLTLASSYHPAFITGAGGTIALAENKLFAGLEAGTSYFNLHTNSFPGGEIRGFLLLQPVPEPETYALMLAGLGLLGFAVRRQRARRRA